MRKQGADVYEDFLPRGASPQSEKPARPEEIIKKRKKPKVQSPPKIGADGLTKAQRRKLTKKAQQGKEMEAKKGFAAALADPQSALNKAAEKTRKRWAKPSNKIRKSRRK